MTTPETQRRLQQQGNDIDALYELTRGVDEKVTALARSVDERFDNVDGRLSEHDQRFDSIDAKLDAIIAQLNNR